LCRFGTSVTSCHRAVGPRPAFALNIASRIIAFALLLRFSFTSFAFIATGLSLAFEAKIPSLFTVVEATDRSFVGRIALVALISSVARYFLFINALLCSFSPVKTSSTMTVDAVLSFTHLLSSQPSQL